MHQKQLPDLQAEPDCLPGRLFGTAASAVPLFCWRLLQMLGLKKPWSASQKQQERDCWYEKWGCSKWGGSLSVNPRMPNSRACFRLSYSTAPNQRPLFQKCWLPPFVHTYCYSSSLQVVKLFYTWGSWGQTGWLLWVRSSCLGPTLTWIPRNRAFPNLLIFGYLTNLKIYYSHWSMENGNQPNENKYGKEFGGGGVVDKRIHRL